MPERAPLAPATARGAAARTAARRARRRRRRRERTRGGELAPEVPHHITVDQVARHWGVKALAGALIAVCLYAGGLKLEGIDGGLGELKNQIASFRAEAQASREAQLAQMERLSTRVDLLEAQVKAHEREGDELRAEWRSQFDAWLERRRAAAPPADAPQ